MTFVLNRAPRRADSPGSYRTRGRDEEWRPGTFLPFFLLIHLHLSYSLGPFDLKSRQHLNHNGCYYGFYHRSSRVWVSLTVELPKLICTSRIETRLIYHRYTLFAVTGTFFLGVWHGVRVGMFRKEAKMGYPAPVGLSGQDTHITF